MTAKEIIEKRKKQAYDREERVLAKYNGVAMTYLVRKQVAKEAWTSEYELLKVFKRHGYSIEWLPNSMVATGKMIYKAVRK